MKVFSAAPDGMMSWHRFDEKGKPLVKPRRMYSTRRAAACWTAGRWHEYIGKPNVRKGLRAA